MSPALLSRATYAMLWATVGAWKLLLILELLGDFEKEWPVAVFALLMALAAVWAAMQWRAWMREAREWPRVGLPLAAVMLWLPLDVLSTEFGR